MKNSERPELHLLVLGSREHVDMDLLKAIGPVEEMSVGEVFGY